MSPARSKRQVVPHRRARAEIVKAVGVGVGIVAVTALLVWLMRPGPAGIPATGGLMNRQPRASWLVGTGIGILAIATWFILRGSRRTRSRAKVLLPTAFGVVLVATVGGGFVWPGGLLRHAVAPPPVPKTTTTVARTTTTTVARATSTTTKSTSTSTSAASTTTAAQATTTPTTGTSVTGTPTTQTATTAPR
ncbi:MAG: hypothetical protein ACLPVY_02195 [Acidimicrobiia bacterium]